MDNLYVIQKIDKSGSSVGYLTSKFGLTTESPFTSELKLADKYTKEMAEGIVNSFKDNTDFDLEIHPEVGYVIKLKLRGYLVYYNKISGGYGYSVFKDNAIRYTHDMAVKVVNQINSIKGNIASISENML